MGMPVLGVSVGPVDNTALVVPFVLAVEADCIAHFKSGYALGKIDIMGDHDGLAVAQADNKPLVTAAFKVVR